MQQHVITTFNALPDKKDLIPISSAFLRALDHLNISSTTLDEILDCLLRLIQQSLRAISCDDPRTLFGMGSGLCAYAARRKSNLNKTSIWSQVYSVAETFGTLVPYLEAVLHSMELIDKMDEATITDHLVKVLIENLHCSSHVVRKLSLEIIERLCTYFSIQGAGVITNALALERCPLDLQSARSASMLVRGLYAHFETIPAGHWLQQAVVHYCFGILNFKLAQLWVDAVDILKAICTTGNGEDTVAAISFRFLEEFTPNSNHKTSSTPEPPLRKEQSQFQCSNLLGLEYGLDSTLTQMKDSHQLVVSEFWSTHYLEPQTPPNSASLALRVLIGLPSVAEKHSRRLVPIFLRWAGDQDEGTSKYVAASEETEKSDSDEGQIPNDLSRKDYKTMLDLFGLFTNPKVLYRSTEVFHALTGLLASGDVSTQKAALKAIFTWKPAGLLPYQESLTRLLDDSSFRDELSVFLNVEHGDSVIQAAHRKEVMPVLLRVLYGKAIARSGARAQCIKRRAVFEALSRFHIEDISEFVRIAVGPLRDRRLFVEGRQNANFFQEECLNVRKQVGLMNMFKDMLGTLGNRLAPLTQNYAEPVMYCTVRAARALTSVSEGGQDEVIESGHASMKRDIRQIGLQCLKLLFEHGAPTILVRSYVSIIVKELVNPRLENLPIETAQSVSGLLQLFATWSSSLTTVAIFEDQSPTLLLHILYCIGVPSAKAQVKLFILENVLKKIVRLAENAPTTATQQSPAVNPAYRVLLSNTEHMLNHVGDLLESNVGTELLESAIGLISMLAPFVTGSEETRKILVIAGFLLEQPHNKVTPKSKGDLVRMIPHFVSASNVRPTEGLHQRLVSAISKLFGYFRDGTSRSGLCAAFDALAESDPDLRHVAELCTKLNAYSSQRLDEPDFETRLAAFDEISKTHGHEFGPQQWRPLLENLLFYVKDEDEIAIRSRASLTLRNFVEVYRGNTAETSGKAFTLVESVLLPSLRMGASEQAESIRVEYLHIMAAVIRYNPEWQKVNDMLPLLSVQDEEASFFGNILHIQQHRRLRALRRLAAEAYKGSLHAVNVAHFFIPLIEHFIVDRADDQTAHNLSGETVVTIAALAQALEWPQFRTMLRRYIGYIHKRPGLEKVVIKLIGKIIDSLDAAASTRKLGSEEFPQDNTDASSTLPNAGNSALASTMPKSQKLADDVAVNLLPPLRQYLHGKDESTVSLRVPVAVSIVKLLKLLPSATFEDQLPPMLTDVCNILRSRTQESRDLTRKTLGDISALIGPSYFGFILRELRSSLSRGYQLHVLSYTVHSILVATADIFNCGGLDHCLPQMVSVIMDDIFGKTAQEKESDDYTSHMKEVKSNKSFDSMELLAKTTSIPNVVSLLRPLQSLLQEKLDLKMVRKVDELLRRIGAGLLRNAGLKDHRVLVFCHEILREVHNSGSTIIKSPEEDYKTKRFLFTMKAASKNDKRGTTSSYGYKLARFALDLLRSTLHRYDTLQTPANLAGFVPIINDSIVQPNQEIQISALRLLTTIIKVPLKAIDDNVSIYITECVRLVKASASTSTDTAQAALKLVSAIIRERAQLEVQETDLAYLLKRLIPDLDEPDRQGVVFQFIKAVLTRKIIVAEVYEVMDIVAGIMITNQTKGARDLARGVYFQFIRDYPQSKMRFSKQISFLVKNLEYEYEEGRRSVMEAINLLLSKSSPDLIQEISGAFFVPLVMVVVNDGSIGCREMASALIKSIFENAEHDQIQTYTRLLRSWLARPEQATLLRAALQVYAIYLDCPTAKSERDFSFLQSCLAKVVKANVNHDNGSDWESLYIALSTFSNLCQASPSHAFAASSSLIWVNIRQCLSYPHLWIKILTARLLGLYFADFARCNADGAEKKPPLRGSGGLLLQSEEMFDIIRASVNILNVPGVSEELAAQSVRNVLF